MTTEGEVPRRRREDDPDAPKPRVDQPFGRRASDLTRAIAMTAFTSAMDAIIAADEAGVVLLFNPAAEALFGYSSEEIVGQPFASLLVPADVAAVHEAALARHLQSGAEQTSTRRIESVAKNKAGDVFPVEIAIARDNSWATPVFTAVIRDVRMQRGLEQSLRDAREKAWAASEAKSEFIAVLSHELRTPLSSIVASTHLLEGETLSTNAQGLVEIQRDAGEALLALTSNILEASRLEAGRDSFARDRFEPSAAARQALRIVASKAQDKGLELIEDFAADLPATLVGDVGRWRQLIINLLTNALKFTETGSVTLSVSTTSLSDTTCLLRTAVSDTGIGMSEEALARVFNPYEQADNEIRGTYGGTGLGLHIVRQIVEAMGGTLSVGSVLGEGSTFAFSIPFALSDEIAPDAVVANAPALEILLVEDHDVNRRLVQRQLEGLGHDVTTAESVAATLEQVGARDFDVILMDVGLPDGDGFVATRSILDSVIAAERPVPRVIALTAGDDAAVRDAARVAGMTGFLTKPLQLGAFSAMVAGTAIDDTEQLAQPKLDLDIDRLEDLAYGVGWSAVVTAATLYADQMPDRLAAISAAAKAADATALAKAVHVLRGVAVTLGATHVSDQCRDIETAAKDGVVAPTADIEALVADASTSAKSVLDLATTRARAESDES